MFKEKNIGAPKHTSHSLESEWNAAFTEWEASVHAKACKDFGVRSMFFDASGSIDWRDRRWGGSLPNQVRLRVVNGKAGIWGEKKGDLLHKNDAAIELLIPLPELGEGVELVRYLFQCWQNTSLSFGGRYNFERAKDLLAGLEIDLADVTREIALFETQDGESVHVSWKGTALWKTLELCDPQTPIFDLTHTIPGFEYAFPVNEDIPEITEAYARWAEKYLNGKSHHPRFEGICAGVLTTSFEDVPLKNSRDPVDKEWVTTGGYRIYTLFLDGEKVLEVNPECYQKILEHLHLVPGGVAVFTMRQIDAVCAAYSDSMVHVPNVFTPHMTGLGARGRQAMFNEVQHQHEELAEPMSIAQKKVEARLAVQEIVTKNAQEMARHASEMERYEALTTMNALYKELHSLRDAPYFRCFDTGLQKDILEVFARTFDASFDASSLVNIRRRVDRQQDVLQRVARARVAAEALAQRENDGEILTNFSAKAFFREHEAPNYFNAWVVRPDGTVEELGGHEIHACVQSDELALAWKKRTAASEHVFAVAKLPVSAITGAQRAAVSHIVQGLAQYWDGSTGLSGNTVSLPVGKGWDLSRVSSGYPAAMPEPILVESVDPNGIIRRGTSVQELGMLLRVPEPPQILPVPTVEEMFQSLLAEERARLEAIALQQAFSRKREALHQEQKAAFTPEVQQELEKKFDELDVYFLLCTSLPVHNAETQKFMKEVRQSGFDSALLRSLRANGKLYGEGIEYCDGKIRGMKELASRKKIREAIPGLWEKISDRVEQWRSISQRIQEEVQRGGDIALLMGETVAGTQITFPWLVERIRARYLENPWGISVADALAAETREIYLRL